MVFVWVGFVIVSRFWVMLVVIRIFKVDLWKFSEMIYWFVKK